MPMTTDDVGSVAQQYASGRRDFSEINLQYHDLRRIHLAGSDLSYADFSGANLAEANLRGCDLSFADFSGANLAGADLRGCMLFGSNFQEAILNGALWDQADFDAYTHFPKEFDPREHKMRSTSI